MSNEQFKNNLICEYIEQLQDALNEASEMLDGLAHKIKPGTVDEKRVLVVGPSIDHDWFTAKAGQFLRAHHKAQLIGLTLLDIKKQENKRSGLGGEPA